ncbi:MAG: hypothetical protein ACRBBN_21880, partial [Methyloligellaceae bacterium]
LAGFILLTTLALFLKFSVLFPISYAIATAGPVLILSHLTYLSRSYSTQEDNVTSSKVEWYPIGNLLFWAAIIASTLSVAFILNVGTSFDTYIKNVASFIDEVLKVVQEAQKVTLSAKDLAQLKYTLAHYIPLMMGASVLLQIILNFWMAAKITQRSDMLARPWPDIRTIETPQAFFIIFAASLAVIAFVPGMPRLLALCFTGTFFLASVMAGLTVIHTITAHMEFRIVLLIALYMALFSMSLTLPVAFIIAIFGVGEPIFKLKQRALERASRDKSDRE